MQGNFFIGFKRHLNNHLIKRKVSSQENTNRELSITPITDNILQMSPTEELEYPTVTSSMKESKDSSSTEETHSTISSAPSSECKEAYKSINHKLETTTWKQCFLERHLTDYLENLEPEQYDPAKVHAHLNIL